MRSDLDRLAQVMDIFRDFDAAFPASYIRAFLTIARKPGLSVTDYGHILGIPQPVVSRLMLQLGEKSRAGGAGLGWIRRVTDEKDLRVKRLHLTPQGQRLMERLEQAMQ